MVAATTSTGYASSVIGCDTEAGIERELSPDETPDGRPGFSLLFFAIHLKETYTSKSINNCFAAIN
jgi:formylmethanofuran--tetrahydromethanopterin N-formyltransferase